MITCECDPGLLGSYVLGVLDEPARAAVRGHLDRCERCRADLDDLAALHAALGDLPPEALLDGPPAASEASDLLLRRTVRQVARERAGATRLRRGVAVLAAAAAVAALAAGAAIDRLVDPPRGGLEAGSTQAGGPPSAADRTSTATNPATGAHLHVLARPAPGGTLLQASVTGVPAGTACRLVVTGADGRPEYVGGWLVSEAGARNGVTIPATAALDSSAITAVTLETADGIPLVTATF